LVEKAVSRLRYNRHAAVEHLCGQCEPLSGFIDQQGPLKLKVTRHKDLFCALAQSIVYQQLSGKAAGTIHGRFCALFGSSPPDADKARRVSIETLRSVGLSQNKALAIQDLAQKSVDGSLYSLQKIGRLDDQAVIDNLVQVRGIGPWTAQMLLIFTLGRPDVMPAADLGVQKGVQAVYRLKKLPTPDQVLRRTRHLAPYRSAASWYFWRAADTALMS
jgi:3-methyladenine DNA glycosylase/8-oxoguanine DNA glycosylase